MPVVPFIAPVATGIMSGISARRNAKRAGVADKAQQAGLAESMATGRQQRQAGTDVLGTALPGYQRASQYYSTLLNGNRAQMRLATAAPTAQITSQYRGAERGLEHMGIRGGERATSLAELNRDRAAAIAGQTTGVQPMAAASLGMLSGNAMGQGLGALSNAGDAFRGTASQYGNRRTQFSKDQRDDMSGVGRSLADLIGVWQRTRGGGAGKLGGTDPWSRTPSPYTYGTDYGQG